MAPRKTALATVEPTEAPPPAVIDTPARMLMIAVERGDDLAKLERLMDLSDRFEAAQAKKQYMAALAAFRATCPTIDRLMKGHTGKYAGLADALEQVNGLLAVNGFSHSWRTAQADGLITVTCTVTHAGGHAESTALSGMPDTSGAKNAIQAVGSTVSYLQRYTMFAILGLASKDQDDDGKGSSDADRQSKIDAAHLAAEVKKGVDEALRKEYLYFGEHTAAVLTNHAAIMGIKAAIAEEFSQLPADERSVQLEDARADWNAMTNETRMALWRAFTRGGCFTTREREFIREHLKQDVPA